MRPLNLLLPKKLFLGLTLAVAAMTAQSEEICQGQFMLKLNLKEASSPQQVSEEELNRLQQLATVAGGPSFKVGYDLSPLLVSEGTNRWKVEVYTQKTDLDWAWATGITDRLVFDSTEWVTEDNVIVIDELLEYPSNEDGTCPRLAAFVVEQGWVMNTYTELLLNMKTTEIFGKQFWPLVTNRSFLNEFGIHNWRNHKNGVSAAYLKDTYRPDERTFLKLKALVLQ